MTEELAASYIDDGVHWKSCRNVFSEAIPAFGLMRIVDVDVADTAAGTSDGTLQVSQPNADSMTGLLVNGPSDIPAGLHGQAHNQFPCAVLFDGNNWTPAVGDACGSAANSWLLVDGQTGYKVGGGDTTDGLVVVYPDPVGASVSPPLIISYVSNVCPTIVAGAVTAITVEYTLKDVSTNTVLSTWCVVNPTGCCPLGSGSGSGSGDCCPGFTLPDTVCAVICGTGCVPVDLGGGYTDPQPLDNLPIRMNGTVVPGLGTFYYADINPWSGTGLRIRTYLHCYTTAPFGHALPGWYFTLQSGSADGDMFGPGSIISCDPLMIDFSGCVVTGSNASNLEAWTCAGMTLSPFVVHIQTWPTCSDCGSGSGSGSGSGCSASISSLALGKTSNQDTNTLTLAAITVAAGTMLVVNFGIRSAAGVDFTLTFNGGSLSGPILQITTDAGPHMLAGIQAVAVPAGATGDIVLTAIGTATDLALSAVQVTCLGSNTNSQSITASNTAGSTTPDAGSFINPSYHNYLQGLVLTNGPDSDAAGTWSNSFSDGTQNIGTSRLFLSEGYRIIISPAATGHPAKTGITSRAWICMGAEFV